MIFGRYPPSVTQLESVVEFITDRFCNLLAYCPSPFDAGGIVVDILVLACYCASTCDIICIVWLACKPTYYVQSICNVQLITAAATVLGAFPVANYAHIYPRGTIPLFPLTFCSPPVRLLVSEESGPVVEVGGELRNFSSVGEN